MDQDSQDLFSNTPLQNNQNEPSLQEQSGSTPSAQTADQLPIAEPLNNTTAENSHAPQEPGSERPEADSGTDGPKFTTLGGMFRGWFLDYASYVILERAVPHITDGLKPVQRRVLYAMHLMENGMLHKVAKIVGATMAYHPHGDASINDALVQLGQKQFLIDTQGNWGNIYTGDEAAAGRYIEAKLSDFALEILFGDTLTQWKKSYDGKAQEPIALPVRFPLLLAQGAEGIAVGLSCKILPHNPRELIEAACAYLKGEEFALYPDFPTGGLIDVERYNDGRRGGSVRSRAKIERIENRILSIKGLPFGKTTTTLIDSILKANEKGKIKIKRVDDMTAEEPDIRITLPAGVSADKTIDGLYAFTDCEVNIWPNACVIQEDKPVFLSVSDLLRYSADQTKEYLRQDLKIRLRDNREQFLSASLEELFIVNRIYKDKEFEEAKNETEALTHIRTRIEALLVAPPVRPITREDLKKLLAIRMAAILRFNLAKHQEMMLRLQKEADALQKHLQELVNYTIEYYQRLLRSFGDQPAWTRRTEIAKFASIEAAKVAETNLKLYIDREAHFAGTGLKSAEYVADCSEIDEFITFYRGGTYVVSKVEEKKFLGKEEVIHIARYIRGDKRTIYNAVYRDGRDGAFYIKRFDVSSCIRDKVYDLTQGTQGSKVIYFSANPNGEAEVISYKFATKTGALKEGKADFSAMAIRNRSSKGNLVTRRKMLRVALYKQGGTTLGGRKVWFDADVNRLNYEGRGRLLGEFDGHDRLLVIRPSGEAYTCGFEESTHFAETPFLLERYQAGKVWTAVYRESEQGQVYLKRCTLPDSPKPYPIQGEGNSLMLITDKLAPQIEFSFAGKDEFRAPISLNAEEFIGIKSVNAKGKRVSTREVGAVTLTSFGTEPQEEDTTSPESDEPAPNPESDAEQETANPAI